jgi:hypothetical protein
VARNYPPTTIRMREFLRLFRAYEIRNAVPTYEQLKRDLNTKNPQPTLTSLCVRGLLLRVELRGARRAAYYITDEGRAEAARGLLAPARRALKLPKSVYERDPVTGIKPHHPPKRTS